MLISLDIGTTNVKAVAFSDRGAVWGAAERRNQILTPQPGWSEQEPAAILQNMREALQEARLEAGQREPLRGLVFSSAMHGLLAVDAGGKPLTNILLWSDLRAAALAEPLRRSKAGLQIYRRTGVPIHPMSPLLKIMWLREYAPVLFARVHKFLGIKEFLIFQLLGTYLSDLSVASATGLLNTRRNRWDDRALALAGITAAQLPALVQPTLVQVLLKKVTTALDLPDDLPIVVGGSDGALANLGSGAVAPGHWAVTIGTSAAIRMVTNQPMTDAKMRSFCYRLDETRCIVGGASNNGTNALEWLRTTVFASRLPAGAFAELAGAVSPGAAGLLFLPYLLGERAPLWDARARGSFRGLSAQHTQAHLVRAVMEGVLFNLKVIAEPLEKVQTLLVIHAGGGFSHSRLWVQMLADLFQVPVHLDRRGVDASVLGALQIGRSALGLPALSVKHKPTVVQPDASRAVVYAEAYAEFKKLLSL